MKSRLVFLSRFPLALLTLMALAIGSPAAGDTHDLKTGAFQVQQELAVTIVTSFEFLPDPAGTKLRLTCNFAGQYEDGTDKIVDQVWRRFLFERLKPYIESGAYKAKTKQ
jgi:hypothetical protein